MSEPFRGFYPPEYTMVPNDLFDALLPDLSGAELKVLLYIIRRTLGFHRDAAAISIAQIRDGLKLRRPDGALLDRGTGLGRTAVTDAIRSLIEKGAIVAQHNESEEYGTRPTTYALRFVEGASAPADGGVRTKRTGASAPADILPIEERKSGERKSDAAEEWTEILAALARDEHLNAGNLSILASYPVHLDGATLVVTGDRKWARYVERASPRPVRWVAG